MKMSILTFIYTLSIFQIYLISISSAQNLTRDYCESKYGKRIYKSNENGNPPAMLYTFPGSGTTLTRLLLEYASGIYTGSVYESEVLHSMMPGYCTMDVTVVKLHTHTYSGSNLVKGRIPAVCIKRNMTKFTSSINIIRSPYDSIWSEYQRFYNSKHGGKNPHVGTIHIHKFDWSNWIYRMITMTLQYKEMIEFSYPALIEGFGENNVLSIRYEDIVNIKTRIDMLIQMLTFLKLPIIEERIQCALILSEDPKVHRTPSSDVMTKQAAYTQEISCRMWKTFEPYIMIYNYTYFGSYDCSNYTAYTKKDLNDAKEIKEQAEKEREEKEGKSHSSPSSSDSSSEHSEDIENNTNKQKNGSTKDKNKNKKSTDTNNNNNNNNNNNKDNGSENKKRKKDKSKKKKMNSDSNDSDLQNNEEDDNKKEEDRHYIHVRI